MDKILKKLRNDGYSPEDVSEIAKTLEDIGYPDEGIDLERIKNTSFTSDELVEIGSFHVSKEKKR